MTRAPADLSDSGALLEAISAALDLLDRHGARPPEARPGDPIGGALALVAPLPSLLDQARALAARAAEARPAPVRLLHHMACTGGTLVARCLAAQPNVLLLSEQEPLSTLGITPDKPRFGPSDMILALRQNIRPMPEATLTRIFRAGLQVLLDDCRSQGRHLVLRSHAHSRYCHGGGVAAWPGLQTLVAEAQPSRGVVTVRHPRASYLSLLSNGWDHYTPRGPEEYARRYMAFLDDHAGLELFRYEDIVADPEGQTARLCAALDLPFAPGLTDLAGIIPMSGGSGRRSEDIGPRPDRPAPAETDRAMAQSPGFSALCRRLGY